MVGPKTKDKELGGGKCLEVPTFTRVKTLGEMSRSYKTQATMGRDERKSVLIGKCTSFVSPKVQGS
jgi:hypothetical protein